MAIDMDAVLGKVKEEIAKAKPAAPAGIPAKPAKPAKPAAAAKPAEQAAQAEEEEGDGGGEVPAPEGKKFMHNFSGAFEKKNGRRPDGKAKEEET